ncbi:uncharacterized protein BJ212DRAFT_612974 [Suillus subaureus]|uniref:Uncharacterized protein n=1 Tax=Suillus subaureus TaxID=48587 RepID=A0A9P7DJ08_9AGAM|nr:uncharacterized protein BJ212DRAFT_612974 [Suillus subaureus]KAG1794967.1 hypothetical protein BJ212DRAFT_612974 [Suillus subaureus]
MCGRSCQASCTTLGTPTIATSMSSNSPPTTRYISLSLSLGSSANVEDIIPMPPPSCRYTT